jgi:hypothetical protein
MARKKKSMKKSKKPASSTKTSGKKQKIQENIEKQPKR